MLVNDLISYFIVSSDFSNIKNSIFDGQSNMVDIVWAGQNVGAREVLCMNLFCRNAAMLGAQIWKPTDMILSEAWMDLR